jgi:drug/metabolite transporter (DMT)-like permease
MSLRSFGVLLLLAAIWGAAFLFIAIGVAEIPPATLVALRLIGAAVILLAFFLARGNRLPRMAAIWRHFFFMGIVGLVAPFLLITWGQQSVASGLTSILITTTPLFSVLIGFLWTKERLRLIQLLGVAIGFGGVVVTIGPGQLRQAADLLGQGAIVLAAVCYAVTGLYGQRVFRGMTPLLPATGQQIAGAVTILPIALAADGLPTAWPSARAIGAVVALAVVCSAFAYILLYWLIERIGATRTSLVSYLLPPFALMYGALLLNEQVTAQQLAGLALVIVGVVLSNGVGDFSLAAWRRRAGAAGRSDAG